MAAEEQRVFMTAWFARAAAKAGLSLDELCTAVQQAVLGQADDLGSGVLKKRLGKNRYRSLILARGHRFWVYAYLFAKQDRANITRDELRGFRSLATLYAQKRPADLIKEIEANELREICQ